MKELNDFYTDAEFKEAEESDARNSVLSKSLAIEKYMSIYLARILDINNYLDSKSFGNTSSALSFNQKVTLISDLKYLDNDEKLKLVSFAEIRNNFAHNSDCITFKDAFTDDLKNRVKKKYDRLKMANPSEDDFKEVVFFLYGEIRNIFNGLKDKIYNEKMNEFLFEYLNFVYQSTFDNIRKMPNKFDLNQLDVIITEVGRLISEKFNFNDEIIKANVKINWFKYFK